jgi:hypothetical protein
MPIRDLAVAAIAAGCTVVAGLSAYTMLAPKSRVPPEAEFKPRVCHDCGYSFLGPPEPVVTDCPACKAHAGVRAYQDKCPKCGEVYDAYYCRYKDLRLTKEDVAEILASGPEPELEYKRPGGEWGPYESLGDAADCPRCEGGSAPPAP